jgi:hypothetical protein
MPFVNEFAVSDQEPVVFLVSVQHNEQSNPISKLRASDVFRDGILLLVRYELVPEGVCGSQKLQELASVPEAVA